MEWIFPLHKEIVYNFRWSEIIPEMLIYGQCNNSFFNLVPTSAGIWPWSNKLIHELVNVITKLICKKVFWKVIFISGCERNRLFQKECPSGFPWRWINYHFLLNAVLKSRVFTKQWSRFQKWNFQQIVVYLIIGGGVIILNWLRLF